MDTEGRGNTPTAADMAVSSQTGQISLFPNGWCWDSDINRYRQRLIEFAERWNMRWESEWSIWEHYPQGGFRMSFYLYFKRLEREAETTMTDELSALCESAKADKIKLTPQWGANRYLYHNALRNGWDTKPYEQFSISVYSEFLDKARLKRKS